MHLPFLFLSKRVWLLPIFMLGVAGLPGCNNDSEPGVSAEKLAQDQKRYMQQVNGCFLREYSAVETFNESIEQLAVALRVRCADEFSALRSAKFNYAMVRDVVEPPPQVVLFELKITQVFVEAARARAQTLFKQHPITPVVPKRFEQAKDPHIF